MAVPLSPPPLVGIPCPQRCPGWLQAKQDELDLVLATRAVSRDPAMMVPVMTEEMTKLVGRGAPNEEIPWFIGEGPPSNLPKEVTHTHTATAAVRPPLPVPSPFRTRGDCCETILLTSVTRRHPLRTAVTPRSKICFGAQNTGLLQRPRSRTFSRRSGVRRFSQWLTAMPVQ